MADSFTPDSFTPDVTAAKPAVKQDSFQADSNPTTREDSFQPETPSANPSERKEQYKITRPEIEDIANKYKVDPDKLEQLAPYFGGSVQPKTNVPESRSVGELAKRTIGEVSENTLLNIPQFAYKKSLSTNEQKALDEVIDRMKDRETVGDIGIHLAAGLPALALGYGAVGEAAEAYNLGKAGILASRLAAPTAIGAVQGVTTSKTGEEAKGAVTGAALGLATGAVLDASISLVKKGLNKAANAATQLWVEKEGAQLADKVATERAPTKELDDQIGKAITSRGAEVPQVVTEARAVPETFYNELAEQGMDSAQIMDQYNKLKLDDEKRDFASYLNKTQGKGTKAIASLDDANQIIKEATSTDGQSFVQKQFDNYKDVQASFKVMREDMDNLNTPKGKFLERVLFFISDNRPIAAIVDKRNGTNLQVQLDNLSQANKAYTLEMHSTLPFKEELATNLKGLDGSKITNAMRSGDISSLSEQEQSIVNKLQGVYEEKRLRANELGIPIQKIRGEKFYVPEQMLEPVDSIVKMRGMTDEINKKLGVDLQNLSSDQFAQIMKDKDVRELISGIKVITHIENVESNPYTFAAALKSSLNPGKASELMDMGASAAFQREGTIPDFLKETDPLKLLNNWDRDTFRAAYYREGIEDLRALRQKYMATGDNNAVSLVQNLLLDLTGRQRGTLASGVRDKLTQISLNAKDKIRKGEDNALTRFTANAPDAWVTITNQVYPNFLGWNPRTALTNLTQPLQMSVPELGAAYGSQLYGQAYMKAVKTILSGEEITLSEQMAKQLGQAAGDKITTKDLGLILRNNGVLGENWNQELNQIMNSGAFSSDNKFFKLAGTANRKLNEIGMYAFDKSESINRYTTDIVAKQVATDLMAGKKQAVDYFNKGLSRGYKYEIKAAVDAGDLPEVQRLMSQHLMAKTQFNYDRITMSELGRFMGPGLSAFLKWPTAIAGDIVASAATKTGKEFAFDVGRRYVAPLAALALAEHLVVSNEDKNSDTYKYFFGREGLTKGAPALVVKDILEGKTAKPPAVAAATDLGLGGLAAIQGDPEKLWKWTNNSLMSYVPQAGLVNFLTTGIPTLTTGTTPKGTFIGKAEQAITGNDESNIDKFFKKNKE